MNIILLPPADKELDEAIEYYNDQQAGLGDRFFSEFIKSAELIGRFPETWKKAGRNTHKINIKRFPYLILYIIDGKDIIITCIAHQHRNPSYYINRI